MNYKITTTAPKVTSDQEALFCGSLLSFADKVKLGHLASSGEGSYAKHVALGDLYDTISDSADEITELIQGYKGILTIKLQATNAPVDCCIYLKEERSRITNVMSSMSLMPDVQNKIQDLIGAISRTIYKLENLE